MRVGTELFIANDFKGRLLLGETNFDISVAAMGVAPGVTTFIGDVGEGYSVQITRTNTMDSISVVITLRGSWEDLPSSPNSLTILAGSGKVVAMSNQRGVAVGFVELSDETEAVFKALNDVAHASEGVPFVFDAKNTLEVGMKPFG